MKFVIKVFLSLFLIIGTVAYAADTASILPPAKTTFIDQNGKPLTSGSVEFFIPGTSTHKTTWQDAAETSPNLNPVILDNAGRALILGSGAYRQVVKDRNNLVIWDQVTASGSGGSGGSTVGDGLAVGSILPWSGFVAPNNYVFTYGQELVRASFSALLANLTLIQNVTCVSGNTTLNTIAATEQLNLGAAIEAACVPAGSVILSKTGSTVTLNNAALVSTTTSATFFPYGNGNGLTTFNVPDYRGYVLPGRCNMGGSSCSVVQSGYYLGEPNALGGVGGGQNQTLNASQLPNHIPYSLNVVANAAYVAGNTAGTFTITAGAGTTIPVGNLTPGYTLSGFVNPTGGDNPHTIIPPSKTVNYIIKINPDTNLSVARCADITDAGTGCTANTGTSGHTIPFLDGANTWSTNQVFGNVSIAGGSITGMPNPSTSSDVANKAYVDSVATGLNILAPSTLASAAVLPNTPTYANGALGVGATLTAGSNTTLTVDGTAAPLNTIVLVKDQASAFQNGIYKVTTAGSGAAAWILTRATYFDQAAEMKAGSYTLITGGATNAGASYTLQTAVTTVGTDALNWVLFNKSVANVVGSGASTVGDIPAINDTTTTSIVSSGYNSSQIPGVIPASSNVTISNASPAVVTWALHGRSANDTIYFCTTSALPSPLVPCVVPSGSITPYTYSNNPTVYYVIGSSIAANTFQIATSIANAKAGTAVNTTTVGSGTHTAYANHTACAGCIGEYIYKTTSISNANVPNNADTVFTSITLTPGLWKVGGNAGVFGTPSGASTAVFVTSHFSYGIGITTICTTPYCGTTDWHADLNNPNGALYTFNETIVPVTVTSVVNAVCEPVWTGAGVPTATCYGELHAVRIH